MLLQYPLEVLIYLVPAIIISLSIHELSHAYVSYRLGDPTAKNMGRLSLNPLRHLDILGTIMILLSGFGWAKPVPINPAYYQDRKKGTMLVSLAGPLSNVILAFIVSFPMIYLEMIYGIERGSFFSGYDYRAMLYNLCFIILTINVSLAVFNIIPVPPLDGSRLLSAILPARQYFNLMKYENFIGIAFLVSIFIFPGILQKVLSPLMWVIQTAINFLVVPVIKMLI